MTRALQLSARDDVAILTEAGEAGDDACGVRLQQPIPAAHKVALHPIPVGAVIRRYGYPIGIASQPIAAGEHVHSHNLVVGGQDTAGSPAPARAAPELGSA